MKFLIGMPGGAEWIVLIFVFLIVPYIFYIITLQSTLNAISEGNRQMPSSNVWLLLIPLFGTIWHFIVIGKLADSIRNEANDRNIYINESRPAYGIGLAMCITNCLIFLPILGTFASLGFLICWIIYWSKMAGYKRELLNAQ